MPQVLRLIPLARLVQRRSSVRIPNAQFRMSCRMVRGAAKKERASELARKSFALIPSRCRPSYTLLVCSMYPFDCMTNREGLGRNGASLLCTDCLRGRKESTSERSVGAAPDSQEAAFLFLDFLGFTLGDSGEELMALQLPSDVVEGRAGRSQQPTQRGSGGGGVTGLELQESWQPYA